MTEADAIRKPAPYAVTMDIGGSHVSAAVVDLAARAILPDSVRRLAVEPNAGADAIVDTWAQAALVALAAARRDRASAVGIAMPSPFDYATGVSLMEHKFGALLGRNVITMLTERWRETPLAATPIRLANDADLFALGEWWIGAAQGCERVIGLTLGTGLGSGFIQDGQIVTSGPDIPPGGEIWNVPYLDGITEDYASGAAISRTYSQATGQPLAPAEIARRAAQDDPAAQAAFTTLGRHLVGILDPYVQRFQPSCIVVGGNIARAWPLFGPQLERAWPGVAVRPSQRFDEAGLLGAAALVDPAR